MFIDGKKEIFNNQYPIAIGSMLNIQVLSIAE